MNKSIVFCIIFTALALAGVSAQQTAPAAEISFRFTRLSGSASNQFAIWIEDASGGYVKTIYATRYTANGGWQRRETSLPLWVRQSNLAELNRGQIDVLTGATPQAGNLTYTWDGTDSRGAAVPAGDYVIVMEATLRWANQVYYRAPLRIGQGAATPQVSVEYVGDAGNDRAMIENVTVRTLR